MPKKQCDELIGRRYKEIMSTILTTLLEYRGGEYMREQFRDVRQ